MKAPNIAVVGATGAVGREVLRILEERDVTLLGLRPIASPRSEGKTVPFRGEDVPVTVISERAFDGVDLIIWDTPDEVAAEWMPKARARAVSIDNSAAFRLFEDVPLVVPEINPEAARTHKGLVANPNCTMVTLVMPLAPLHRAARAHRVVCSSYQSTSGAGMAGVDDLYEQLEKLLPEREAVRRGDVDLPPGRAFAHPIAFNIIPHVGGFDDAGTTSEERRVASETQKVLGADIDIFATTVRVPTVVGHGISAWVEFERPIDAEEARAVLSSAAGVVLEDDPKALRYPTVLQSAGLDKAIVGRVRNDPANTNALGFFSTCDNLRKGAALNAVQIAELLIDQNLI
ncbi:MAG: aspartate-semialdehyde dehydrogenase [Actinomycetota bacterium]